LFGEGFGGSGNFCDGDRWSGVEIVVVVVVAGGKLGVVLAYEWGNIGNGD